MTRWGMRIFTTDNPRQGWDGTLHGEDSPEGIYVIRLQVTDCRGTSRPRQASITLIR
ncbi:MAG: gliding motility-associated C-terminal domain-containing protein [Bacteroidia bacterium]